MGYNLRNRKIESGSDDAGTGGENAGLARKRRRTTPAVKLPYKKSDLITKIEGIPSDFADKLAQNGIKKVSDLAKANIVDVFFDSHLSGQHSWEWINALHYLAVTKLNDVDAHKLSPNTWSSSRAPTSRSTNISEKSSTTASQTPVSAVKPSVAEFNLPNRGLFSPSKTEEKKEQAPKAESAIPPEALERRVSKEELKQQKEQLVHIPTGKALHDVVDAESLSDMKSHLKATIPPNAPALKSPRLAPLANTHVEATKNITSSPKLEAQTTWQPKMNAPSWGNAESSTQQSIWGSSASGNAGNLWDKGSNTSTGANNATFSSQPWAPSGNKNNNTLFGNNTGNNTSGNNPLGPPKVMRI